MIVASLFLGLALQGRGPVDHPLDSPIYGTVLRYAKKSGLSDLRTLKLEEKDVELRVWSGFSWGDVRGFVLARRSGTWRASVARLDTARPKHPAWIVRPVATPKGGWNGLWSELDALGLRTIPDEASLPDDGMRVDDGTKVFFEVRRGTHYRAFYYDNPYSHLGKPTAQIVARMMRILGRTLPGGYL